MGKNEYQKIQLLINKCEEYYPLDEQNRQDLYSIVSIKKIDKDGFFVRAGDYCDTAGFLVSGMIRYFYVDPDGREYTRYFCRAGNFVSSYTSILAGRPSAYAIQALDNIELIVFSMEDWNKLNSKDPVWSALTIKVLEGAQLIAEERERSLILDSAADRYLSLINDFPGIEEKAKQYDLASYLGITPVALSRIRGRLKKSGKIY